MVLSYSAAAKPASSETGILSTSNSIQDGTAADQPVASSSKARSSAPVKHLILDAGPLLSMTPLRHLAETFHTTPMVVAELRDPKAREYWERLGLTGIDVKVESPSAEAMAEVVAFARKTGDYAVLSKTDLSVVALTWQYEVLENGKEGIRKEPGQKLARPDGPHGLAESENKQDEPNTGGDDGSDSDGSQHGEEDVVVAPPEDGEVNAASKSIEHILLDDDKADGASSDHSHQEADARVTPSAESPPPDQSQSNEAEDSESDGGEWITSSNLSKHRNRDLGLLPDQPGKAPSEVQQIAAACMTGDFAVQNVLLGIGLGLVGEGGKRISKVKSWILRCHACFKLCKDPSKRFCPSCGNATLLRTTVTTSASTGKQHIHLKKNFQYHLKGSKYTIPDAKPGRAKGQQKGGTGLILREDQIEWQNAVKSADIQRQKEEKRLAKGGLDGWNDPDWLPPMITVGMSGKGRSDGQHMPAIGHGRKNPNHSRRKR
ncbi:Nin one binding Zn-ribbon like-domain-containing protein [Kockovaella imperatae]|uniref:20S-pre-rRNA D-site endonuclease NOB1 n=1 Tax=Kockovaella imperatae TaxID=4999 RepID=A0A1Y1UA63_9TREE|nr:Nin one binding Zn-ribbon like-domain-containing protein [Kockovaella imperatae]ORX34902.1 Nin one binding Zn-ribbon like-domain-containing protein [Kockovaella imperatae]